LNVLHFAARAVVLQNKVLNQGLTGPISGKFVPELSPP
jgi:hypothetical protein